MTPEIADSFGEASGCYVHIPFCARVCPYCDFAVVAGKDDLAERYVDAVKSEAQATEAWRPLDSIYIGGGTPSHVDPHLLDGILGVLAGRHGLAADPEISLEANPEDFTVERATALREAGFNRVSFGAQSFDSSVLVSLGRVHDRSQIEKAVESAREAGFENASVDLIYGTPGESSDSWSETLALAIDLGVDHISCYALTVEKGTPLGRAVAGGAAAPDPDTQAEFYERAQETLAKAGLEQYEVSNWARPGKECRYNMTVWAGGEYLAHGNSAHGHRHQTRYRNIRRLEAYMAAVEAGEAPRAGEDPTVGWDAELERLFVGLRRRVGVAAGPGTEALLTSDEGQRLLEAGVIEEADGRLVVKRPLFTDTVHRAVLAL